MSTPLKVLIIDDDLSFRRLVEIRLKDWREDLLVTTAASLAEATEKLDQDCFELVVMDQHLPDGNSSEFFHKSLEASTVLAISSDESPHVPANAVKSGAQHFLAKRQVSDPLLVPLIEALLERKKLEKEILAVKIQESKMNSICRLLTTLQHEINNPLGAVLGGTYLIKSYGHLDEQQKKAVELIDQSGKRIKHVIEELCEAADLKEVAKASEEVYEIPGDSPWEDE